MLSRATRERFAHRAGVRYGAHADEVLDIFPATPGGPIQVFVHGGAWKNFTKDDYSFPADAYVPAGINTVILNFSKLPAERLPTAVDQVRRGIEWVRANAASFGGDPSRLYVSAQSSGAHLAASALEKGASELRARGDAGERAVLPRAGGAEPPGGLREARARRGAGAQPGPASGADAMSRC